MQKDYTLAITSCDRHELLGRTLKSFLDHADIPPSDIVVVEDGPKMPILNCRARVVKNHYRQGQVCSLDRLYGMVKTEYVFHLEDDFEFHNGDFIGKSFDILENWSNISGVSLRSDWPHPLVQDFTKYPFPIAQPWWGGVWGGWTWNPSLHRTEDVRRFGKFQDYDANNGLHLEAALSLLFLEAGYRIAVLGGKCNHIGAGEGIEANRYKVV